MGKQRKIAKNSCRRQSVAERWAERGCVIADPAGIDDERETRAAP